MQLGAIGLSRADNKQVHIAIKLQTATQTIERFPFGWMMCYGRLLSQTPIEEIDKTGF